MPIRTRLEVVALVVAACALGCGKGSKKASGDEAAAAEAQPAARIAVAVTGCEEQALGSTTGTGGMGMVVSGDACKRTQGRPVIRVGQTVVGGGLDKAAVRRAVRRKMKEVRGCYEKQLAENPKLEGKLVVDLSVDLAGRVTNIRARGLQPKVAACVERVIEGTLFPKSHTGGILKVRLPFQFRSCAHVKKAPTTRDAAVPAGVTDVAAHLAANIDPFQTCFEQARERGGEVPATLRLDIAVQSDGRVADARSPDVPAVEKPGGLHLCVGSAARAMTFPASAGGARKARCTLTSGTR